MLTHEAIPTSRLYTLIDEQRQFALYFLEGQKLIQDLALVHDLRGAGFAYFRDAVLSVQPMIAFLKAGEQLGFYIDSDRPDFRLKIETGHHGATRCALVPDSFREFPEQVWGIVRLLKLFPGNRPPYESVIDLEGLPLRGIVNEVLRNSYQVNSAIVVSPRSDQSLMLHQLPPSRSEDYEYSLDAVRARRDELQDAAVRIFDRALVRADEIQAAFAEIGFREIASREVQVRCGCSRERMLAGVRLAAGDRLEDLFDPGDDTLSITCEYCKATYRVSRAELEDGGRAN